MYIVSHLIPALTTRIAADLKKLRFCGYWGRSHDVHSLTPNSCTHHIINYKQELGGRGESRFPKRRREIYASWLSRSIQRLEEIQRKFKAKKSRTAKLWLQFIEYIENLKLFTRSEDNITRKEQVLGGRGESSI